MLENFRSYQLAVQLHKDAKGKQLPVYLKDQLLRATLGIALNLAEGSGRKTYKDRKRFYTMAFGSIREVQAIIDLNDELQSLASQADVLAAHLYSLTR